MKTICKIVDDNFWLFLIVALLFIIDFKTYKLKSEIESLKQALDKEQNAMFMKARI